MVLDVEKSQFAQLAEFICRNKNEHKEALPSFLLFSK